MLTYIESFGPYSNFIVPILQTREPGHRDSKFTSVMEFRFEIRLPGSIICTLKRWKEWKKMKSSFSFILLFSSPITFLIYRAKADRWAVRKTNVLWSLWRIWKGVWEEWAGEDGADAHLVKVFTLLQPFRPLAGVKIWTTNEVQPHTHIRPSMKMIQSASTFSLY